MPSGKEMKHGKKYFLVVNKQGFGSVYALLILQVVLVFSITLLSMTQQQARFLKMDQQHQEAQILAIYYVKQKLHQDIWTSDEIIDENAPIEPYVPIIETISYKDNEITITFEETYALVEMALFRMQILYDTAHQYICDLVYL